MINSALGFDSFLVMRHGVKSDSDNIVDPKDIYLDNNRISGNKLGCYFCNDIVAPGNVSNFKHCYLGLLFYLLILTFK